MAIPDLERHGYATSVSAIGACIASSGAAGDKMFKHLGGRLAVAKILVIAAARLLKHELRVQDEAGRDPD